MQARPMKATGILIAAAISLAFAGAGAAEIHSFHWGVNGHPNVQEGYRQVTMEAQLDLVGELGAGWYRCDWDQTRLERDLAFYDTLVAEASRRGIRMLPVLQPTRRFDGDATPEEIRASSFEFARWLVSHFRGRITHWELDNELDLVTMIRKGETTRTGVLWQWGDPNGDKPEHYEESRYEKARAELLGLHAGVKTADPNAFTIVDTGGWLHYGFIERLVREDQVPFDILGWHWYSEMGDVTEVRGEFNLLEHLKGYGKPIWFTEVNRRAGSQGGREAAQARYLSQVARQLRSYPGVAAFFIYELLDEPYFGADNPESHYGLVRLTRDSSGKWAAGARKAAFSAVREVIAEERSPGTGRSTAARSRGAHETFAQLPERVRNVIDVRLRRRSDEIASSPFATLLSPEVHAAQDDAAVMRLIRDLGVKWVVMHNLHGALPNAEDPRLNSWLDMFAEARVQPYCILVSRDLDLWRAAVRNYGDRISHFGFLNESNAPTDDDHTRPHVPPAAYAAGLREVRAAVKGVCSDVTVYAPECAMLQCMEEWPYPWLRLTIEAGALDAADGISIHPYRQAYSPVNIPENPSTFEGRATPRYSTYEEQIQALRSMIGDKPLAVTEVGWSTVPQGPLASLTKEGISELTQAKFALRQQIMDFALGMEIAVYFMLRDRDVDRPFPADHIENHFGIVRSDHTPKPAYTALQTLYSQLDDSCTRNQDVRVTFSVPDVKWYVFDDDSRGVPMRKVFYWLPRPARDDFTVRHATVWVGDVLARDVPVSDAPCLLRLHQVDGRWGHPVIVDLIEQRMNGDISWTARRGQAADSLTTRCAS